MKKVFVLLGGYDYEGYQLLGVYSSYKKAEENQRGGYDFYDIRHWNINGEEIKKREKKLSKKQRDAKLKKFFESNKEWLKSTLPETLLNDLSIPEKVSFRKIITRAAKGK